jgi:HAD superfamily hydrolase (TIGR01490 family)
MNLAIFDFCETLVNFQTADRFCRYTLERNSKQRYLKFDYFLKQSKIYSLLSKMGVKNFQKRFLLMGLKNMTITEIQNSAIDFLKEEIEPKLNQSVFELFQQHIKQGDFVVINSGGYEPYIKSFSEKHLVNKYYATQLAYSDNLLSGKILGADCLGIEKVIRMEKDGVLKQHFNEVFVYSDSVTDLPIFNLASNKYAIMSSNEIPQWAQNNFEIIHV